MAVCQNLFRATRLRSRVRLTSITLFIDQILTHFLTERNLVKTNRASSEISSNIVCRFLSDYHKCCCCCSRRFFECQPKLTCRSLAVQMFVVANLFVRALILIFCHVSSQDLEGRNNNYSIRKRRNCIFSRKKIRIAKI